MMSIPINILLTANALVLGLVALLHVYWVLGGRWGLANALPQRAADTRPVFIPGRLMTLAVAGGLGLCLLLNVLPYLNSISLPGKTTQRYALLVLGGAFSLRTLGDFMYVGLTKRVRNTPFAAYDTRWYTPLCAALALSHLACFALLR